MQHKRIEVSTVGPHDGPELVVHSHLCKEAWVGEWLKDRAVQLSCEIDISRAVIAEAEPQPVVTKHLCGRDRHEVHRLILKQGVDRLSMKKGATALRAVLIGFELLAVQIGALCHEFERASRQTADQYLAAPDRDHATARANPAAFQTRFVVRPPRPTGRAEIASDSACPRRRRRKPIDYDRSMCRNIRNLNNFDPPATDDEIRASALQYVRKISGSTKPSQANADAFERAVDAVTEISTRLLDELVTNAPPKNREVEAAKARARAAQRYAA